MRDLATSELHSFLRLALREMTSPEFFYRDLMELTLAKLTAADVELPLQEGGATPLGRIRKQAPLTVGLIHAYSQIVALGYVVPISDLGAPPNPSSQELYLTDLGRTWCANSSEVAPEDINAFMALVGRLAPGVDDVVVTYAREAARCYGQRLYFASAVMLGAASEKATYLLLEAIHNSYRRNPSARTEIRKVIKDRGLPTMFGLIERTIEKAKSKSRRYPMPHEVHEGSVRHLLSIQEGIRVQRNDAVHPEAGKITQESVLLSLTAFPYALRSISKLTDWFARHRL